MIARPEPEPDVDPGLDPEVLRRRRERTLTIVALLLVLGVSVFTAHRLLRTPPVSRSELAMTARQAVKDSLPGMAVQFGGLEELTIEPRGESNYEVKGNALGITPQGKTISYLFTCDVERGPDGKWRPATMRLTLLYPPDLAR